MLAASRSPDLTSPVTNFFFFFENSPPLYYKLLLLTYLVQTPSGGNIYENVGWAVGANHYVS
jgi:hypothetical protein